MLKSSLSHFTSIIISFLMNLKVPALSRRTKESIKVALAFTIAYLIALRVGWLSPFWAGFTIGQVALFANTQSLHKGALRLSALVPAIIVATFIFAVAIQDRWLFVSLGVTWIMVATYMIVRDQQHDYMWQVAGFVVFIFLTASYTTSADLFNQMSSRFLDAALGISIYTLVTVMIWPDSNIRSLKKTCINLAATQSKIFTLLASPKDSVEDKNTIRQTIKQEILLLNGLKLAFYAKGSETYQVQEAAGYWKEFYSLSMQLGESFSRLNNSDLGLRNIDIYRLIPDIENYREIINQRFTRAGDILKNGAQEFKDETLSLSIDKTYLESLPPFDQLAFISSKTEFEETEALSRRLLRCANNIVDESVRKKEAPEKIPKSIYERLTPDIDLLMRMLYVGSLTFASFLIWIYFDPPGHMQWFYLPTTIALVVAVTPQMKTNVMIAQSFFILFFILFFIYALILPKISGMFQLSVLLFTCMFILFQFFDPIPRLIGLIGIATKLSLTNVDQTFDFAWASNHALLNVGAYAMVFVFSYMLDTPRPEKAVLKRIKRYYKGAQFLASMTAAEKQNKPQSIWTKFQVAFYRYEVKTLPPKIHAWSNAINHKNFPNNTPEAIADLLLTLNALSNSLEEWLRSNNLPQTPLMFTETKEELEQWRKGIESIFQNYTHHLDSSLSHNMHNALSLHIKNLEEIINKHGREIKEAKKSVSEEDKANLFRLIGSYQSLSYALISYASMAEKIDWKQWEEEMFS